MNNTATNTATCPTVRKQIGKTTYIVRVHFSETAKETMEDKIRREAVRPGRPPQDCRGSCPEGVFLRSGEALHRSRARR